MSANAIDKLESQFQALIEGAFTHLFRRRLNARDLAILLLRAMETNACPAGDEGTRPFAPDEYAIFLHPESHSRFLDRFPDLSARLSRIIAALSAESGYRLLAEPAVALLADADLEARQVRIRATHSPASSAKTAKMAAVSLDAGQQNRTQTACLHIVGMGAVPLAKAVINIGRESSNDVVINDAFVSRHHAQLRKRAGVYTLFDASSRGGTLVNRGAIREHRLQNGDVIRIGRTDLVFAEDGRHFDSVDSTQVLSPD